MSKSKLKFSMFMSPSAPDDELLFAKQLGLDCVYTWVNDDQMDYHSLVTLRKKVEDVGLILYNAGNYRICKCDKIHLNLPGRDEKIEQFKEFLANLAKAGIYTTTFTWEASGVWSSERQTSRFAPARHVDLDEMLKRPYTHGREYTVEEIWDNYTYFIQQVLPVAEQLGVRLSLHPNDPPVPMLGGVPCLIHDFDCYKKAFAIGDSPNLGMEFCVGCWLEGGKHFGDVLAGIKYFGERKKINIVHFRNVSSPLPKFTETFLDNGYMDMYQVMKALVAVDYDGTVILDHTPLLAIGDKVSASAYAIGYMRALFERAKDELGID